MVKYCWKQMPVKTWSVEQGDLQEHYKKGNEHAYLYFRGHDLVLIRGKLTDGHFKKTSQKTMHNTWDNWKKMMKPYHKKCR